MSTQAARDAFVAAARAQRERTGNRVLQGGKPVTPTDSATLKRAGGRTAFEHQQAANRIVSQSYINDAGNITRQITRGSGKVEKSFTPASKPKGETQFFRQVIVGTPPPVVVTEPAPITGLGGGGVASQRGLLGFKTPFEVLGVPNPFTERGAANLPTPREVFSDLYSGEQNLIAQIQSFFGGGNNVSRAQAPRTVPQIGLVGNEPAPRQARPNKMAPLTPFNFFGIEPQAPRSQRLIQITPDTPAKAKPLSPLGFIDMTPAPAKSGQIGLFDIADLVQKQRASVQTVPTSPAPKPLSPFGFIQPTPEPESPPTPAAIFPQQPQPLSNTGGGFGFFQPAPAPAVTQDQPPAIPTKPSGKPITPFGFLNEPTQAPAIPDMPSTPSGGGFPTTPPNKGSDGKCRNIFGQEVPCGGDGVNDSGGLGDAIKGGGNLLWLLLLLLLLASEDKDKKRKATDLALRKVR